MDGMKIRNRASQRQSERSNIDGIWNLIERFIVPFRAMVFQDKNQEGNVRWRRREIYDPTAINANNNLAAHIHGALTNSVLKWFNYGYKQPDIRENHEAKMWLEAADRITYQSIQESNFDLEANEIYLDLTSFGSGSMSSMPVETSTGALEETEYKTFPVDECYFDHDVRGRLINFYRVLQWTAIQIYDKFGESTPERIKVEAQSENRSTVRHKICFCIYKREGMDDFNPFVTSAPENRLFGSKYILWADASQLGEEGGHHEMPIFAPRWRRASGSQWGYSPSMIAIWDVLTLNQLVELVLVAGEKVLDPTLMTTKKGVFGDIDLSAGGTVVVQDLEKSMKAFESKARFDVSGLNKMELIRAIESTYFVDQLQLKESPAMTATEVSARVQLMQRLLGPTFGRLQTDFLDPCVTRQFMINFRYGLFPPMPQILVDRQADLQIEYIGSLAKAQRMDAVSSIERWVGTTSAMNETLPGATDNINRDEVVREMAEIEGIPAKLQVSPLQVQKDRKARAAAKAQERDIAMQAAQGDAMKQQGEGMQAMNPQQAEV